MFGISPSLFWIIAVIVLSISEAATLGLTAIWFAVGALFAAISVHLGFSVLAQIIVFLVVSAIMLLFTKPIVEDKLKVKNTPTNLDRIIGQTSTVTEDIDNELGTGQIKINGLVWTARSQNGEKIPKNSKIEVVSIQGVKAIVKLCIV